MKRLNLKPNAVLLVLAALLSGCSGPSENSGPTNTNAPQQANSNSAPPSQVAQGSPAPGAPPPAVQLIPPPPAPAANANAANATIAGNARAPKLVAPEKKLNYGKQPQDKTLVRAIVIKNGGLANLNIESVVPS